MTAAIQKLPEGLINASILVVEDMSFYISLISQSLANNGFKGEVLKASNLHEAFDLVSNHYKNGKTIGLIIADLHLPDGKGTLLCSKIRGVDSLAKIPFIIITTDDNAQQVVEAFELGIDNYIFKPVDDKMFSDKINFVWKKYNP